MLTLNVSRQGLKLRTRNFGRWKAKIGDFISGLRAEVKRLVGELTEAKATLATKVNEVNVLSDDKKVAEEAKKLASKNLEKLINTEREVHALRAEEERLGNLLKEQTAKVAVFEQQLSKLKQERDELTSVSSQVYRFQR